MLDLARLAAVGLTAGLFSYYLAGRRFIGERWWDRKVQAYEELVSALAELVNYYDEIFDAEFSGRRLNDNRRSEINVRWRQGHEAIRRTAKKGAFLISVDVDQALKDLLKELSKRRTDWFDEMDSHFAAVNRCLEKVRLLAKQDLGVGGRWPLRAWTKRRA